MRSLVHAIHNALIGKGVKMSESPKWQWDIYYKAVPNVPKETLLRALHAFDEEKIQIGNILRRK